MQVIQFIIKKIGSGQFFLRMNMSGWVRTALDRWIWTEESVHEKIFDSLKNVYDFFSYPSFLLRIV